MLKGGDAIAHRLREARIKIFENKLGQVTIFIIIGVLIVSSVALFFALRSGLIPEFGGATESNPNIFLSTCLDDKIKDTATLLSLQGGYVEPNPLSVRFRFEEDGEHYNISYLCYTPLNYVTCVNQNPLLISHVEEEIKNEISDEVRDCFDEMEKNFERQNFGVNLEYNGFEVDIKPRRINVETTSQLTLTKNEGTTTQENFKIETVSRLYEILQTVQEIANQEAEFCNFNKDGFMLTYPEFKIEKFNIDDKGMIYTVRHKDTDEKFRFVVRSCFIPSGVVAE